jgi:hypothetical protein
MPVKVCDGMEVSNFKLPDLQGYDQVPAMTTGSTELLCAHACSAAAAAPESDTSTPKPKSGTYMHMPSGSTRSAMVFPLAAIAVAATHHKILTGLCVHAQGHQFNADAG